MRLAMLLKLAMVVLLTAFQGADVETATDGVEVTERYTLLSLIHISEPTRPY